MANFVDRSDFIDAMRHAAAAVSIVTTHDADGGRVGMTISAMCSVTADPPSLLVCLHEQSSVAKLTEASGVFCVNVLSAAHVQLADCFAGRMPEIRERKFELGDWGTLVTGAPVLKDAEAVFDCRVVSRTQIGTHLILIGAVEAVHSHQTEPLLYLDRRYRVLNDACALS
jgi:flavin reductase (DIM6/NTAB) family NADH-FMN oxidoreductase RutF